MNKITLRLPYPISANRYWRTRVNGKIAMTYTSPEAKAYKSDVAALARIAGLHLPIDGRVSVEIKLFPQRPQDWAKRSQRDPECWDDDVRCIDLGNCEKVLSDALNGVAWIDDKQLRKINLERMEPDGEARVEITITAMPRSKSELFAA